MICIQSANLAYLNGSVIVDVAHHHADGIAVGSDKKRISLSACLNDKTALVKLRGLKAKVFNLLFKLSLKLMILSCHRIDGHLLLQLLKVSLLVECVTHL